MGCAGRASPTGPDSVPVTSVYGKSEDVLSPVPQAEETSQRRTNGNGGEVEGSGLQGWKGCAIEVTGFA